MTGSPHYNALQTTNPKWHPIKTNFKPPTPQQEIDFAVNAKTYGKVDKVDIGVPSILDQGGDPVLEQAMATLPRTAVLSNTKITKVVFENAAKPLSLNLDTSTALTPIAGMQLTFDPNGKPSANEASFLDMSAPRLILR